MKLDLKKNNDYSRTINIDLSWDDIKDDYYKEYKKVKSSYQIPGFRKGKVPDNILRKNVGPSIDAQFVDNFVNVYYKQALDQLKITPINQGQILNIDFKESSDLKCSISFEVKPEFSLPNYKKKIKIKTNKYIVNNKDLDESIKRFQAQHAKSKTVSRSIKKNHFIYADFNKLDENKNIVENSTIKNHYVRIGEGIFVGDLEKKFIGKKIGETIDAKIDQDSGTVNYRIKINKIEEQILPEVNDEFAKTVDPEVENLKSLNEKILLNLQKNLDNENKKELNNKIIDYFIDKTKITIPESILENYEKHLNNQYKEQATSQGQSYDESKFKNEIKETSSKTAKWHMIKERIVNDEDIKISSKDIDAFINDAIKKNPKHKDEIKKYYGEDNNRFNLHEEIVNTKLFELLDDFFINQITENSTDKLRNKKGAK